jgi:transcriptional regulator GlxA family with amidase domain
VERHRAVALPQPVRKALDVIRTGAGTALTREAVARQAGVSPRALADLLKERTGRSFSELLREARIERACELLVKTELTVAAIALDSGFCDQSYFTHVFQDLKKTTPRQYRLAGKGQPASPEEGPARKKAASRRS